MPSPTDAPVPPAAQPAPADAGLPAEIVQAVSNYRYAVKMCARTPVTGNAEAEGRAYRALCAAILSRLTAAEAMGRLAADAGWELDWDRVRAERDAALARAERLEEALRECVIQIEYEHDKFGGTGSGETVLHRTRALLAEETRP